MDKMTINPGGLRSVETAPRDVEMFENVDKPLERQTSRGTFSTMWRVPREGESCG